MVMPQTISNLFHQWRINGGLVSENFVETLSICWILEYLVGAKQHRSQKQELSADEVTDSIF